MASASGSSMGACVNMLCTSGHSVRKTKKERGFTQAEGVVLPTSLTLSLSHSLTVALLGAMRSSPWIFCHECKDIMVNLSLSHSLNVAHHGAMVPSTWIYCHPVQGHHRHAHTIVVARPCDAMYVPRITLSWPSCTMVCVGMKHARVAAQAGVARHSGSA